MQTHRPKVKRCATIFEAGGTDRTAFDTESLRSCANTTTASCKFCSKWSAALFAAPSPSISTSIAVSASGYFVPTLSVEHRSETVDDSQRVCMLIHALVACLDMSISSRYCHDTWKNHALSEPGNGTLI